MTLSNSTKNWRKNIFLDFLNPDVRRVAGAYSKYTKKQHVQEIFRGIKIALLLGDKLILPPSFILQCPFVRLSLSRCQALMEKNVILFPMRESRPDIFYQKKKMQYGSVKEYYKDIQLYNGLEIIQKHQSLFVQRKARMGQSISSYWLDSSLPTIKWEVLQEKLPRRYDIIRKSPIRLVENNIAVTAPALQRIACGEAASARDEIDLVLQGIYGIIYMDEFEAAVITSLPIQPWDFGLPKNEAYNYLNFRDILDILGLFDKLVDLSFHDICLLRNKSGYLKFLKFYMLLFKNLSKSDLLILFSEAVRHKQTSIKRIRAFLAPFSTRLNLSSYSKINAIDDYLFEISDSISVIRGFIEEGEKAQIYSISQKLVKPEGDIVKIIDRKSSMRVMIFSALKEELDYLINDHSLRDPINDNFDWNYNSEYMYYHSLLRTFSGEEIEVYLVTPDEAGLVPTAILAAKIKDVITPDLSIMIGICAGRRSEGICLGDIIMPYKTFLYHYGAYQSGKVKPEIRLEKIGKNILNWAANLLTPKLLTEFFNFFPSGSNKPRSVSKIRKEPIGCGDLIVKDISIIEAAQKQDRKLIGVDMESYSFVRAIGEENKVLMFKAVTDYADENKDDQFRDYCKYLTARCVLLLLMKIDTSPIRSSVAPLTY